MKIFQEKSSNTFYAFFLLKCYHFKLLAAIDWSEVMTWKSNISDCAFTVAILMSPILWFQENWLSMLVFSSIILMENLHWSKFLFVKQKQFDLLWGLNSAIAIISILLFLCSNFLLHEPQIMARYTSVLSFGTS